ncbi:hypothetical protein [Vibrio cholerae]|uniref:hypothetical protein n=1 Tax=Vibrio cholerae TaxID=666 RepID=UPI0005116EC0|nr:hypothetical protein [Vibrio cholerae]MBO1403848.1 hypothetical protein [Vibrio cholerae]WOQ92404.1 hypothetical protein R4533_06735 [Vibrio cholerae]
MNIEITDLVGVAAFATSFLAYLEARKANKHAKSGEIVEALGKVITASEKTQTYLQQRADGGERDRNIEWELAEHWSHAAFIISRIDKDLSSRLHIKSRLWRDPETWNKGIRATKDISLDHVSGHARKLMETYA